MMRSRAFVVFAVLATSLVAGGWLLERGLNGNAGPSGKARLFAEVLRHVERDYVDSLSDSALYGRAMDGLLRELHDPHTTLLRADRLSRLNESTTGNYAGVGIQIDIRDGWITVVAPLPGSPAEHAGIESGDRIVEIAGRSTHQWTSEEAQRALRGAPGTSVTMRVERPGVGTPIVQTLTRTEIHRSAVRRALDIADGVGYVVLNVFSDSTALELKRSVDSLRAAGAHALVLDLRGNPGGLLSQGVGVADLFLDSGQEIVRMRGRVSDANHVFTDDAREPWPDMPVVVLINGASASASEIVAGALQDHDRAVIVGTTSYGKGSAQSLYPLDGGAALKLTTARWYTPSGRSISRQEHAVVDEDAAPGDSTIPPVRMKFRTDRGRTVFGGGGITPDLVAGDTTISPAERALTTALGGDVGRFRDAITEYALAVKAARSIPSPDFAVTPAMRDDVWRRMVARGLHVDRRVYDAATPVVDRLVGREIARYAFGPVAEARRAALEDPVVRTALDLLHGVGSRGELLARATQRVAPTRSE